MEDTERGRRDGEMAQQLTSLAALAEGWGLISAPTSGNSQLPATPGLKHVMLSGLLGPPQVCGAHKPT